MLHLLHLLLNYGPIGTQQATQPRAMLVAIVEAIAEEDGRTRTGQQEAISGIIPITVGRHVNTKSVDSISSVSDLPTVAPIVHQLQNVGISATADSPYPHFGEASLIEVLLSMLAFDCY